MPIGLFYNMTMLPHWASWRLPPFTDLASYKSKPTLTVWQGSAGGGGGWFNNRFYFTSHDPSTGHIGLTPDGVWPSGGWQGGRTWHTVSPSCGTTGPLVSGNFHINGVFEELDAPGEFYLDVASAELYLFYNNSIFPPGTPQPAPNAPPPTSLVLVSPQLEILFNLSGSADAPVADVTFAGIDFRDQRDGFLEDWIVPSGGDWGLRRAGALHLAGTARATVDGCSFIRTDGNAIAISGWNRNATISSTEFKWLGMSAVVEMGYTDEEDGTAGEQPWGTVITGCAVSELGLLEKQSSALFLGKTPLTRFEGNLAFNGPRAMVNFNDGFGGGHNTSLNAMWNTCRETGDHGP
jgi:hypothetical protein